LVIHGVAAGTRREYVLGVAAAAWSMLVGLMLAGQQSRPHPGATDGGGATDFNG